MTAKRLGLVLVNWNRWADTIECLESLQAAAGDFRVVVVDNASSDGSADRIEAWARGDQPSEPTDAAMARFSTPAGVKPVAMHRLAGPTPPGAGDEWLTLIESGENLGFAGGNNIGLRYLLADPDIEACWLLNNDTVVDADAPAAVLDYLASNPKIGICGTIVRFYHRPAIVQALNGSRFNRWTGTSAGIAAGLPAAAHFDATKVARATDFVLGASLAVTRSFLETVGLMEESYFLYFEEIDWAWRARGRFTTGFASRAVVYHKEGGSIGSSSRKGGRSSLSEYYLMRSKLKFIARHRPWLLPAHWGVAAVQIALRVARGQPAKAVVMTRALLGLRG